MSPNLLLVLTYLLLRSWSEIWMTMLPSSLNQRTSPHCCTPCYLVSQAVLFRSLNHHSRKNEHYSKCSPIDPTSLLWGEYWGVRDLILLLYLRLLGRVFGRSWLDFFLFRNLGNSHNRYRPGLWSQWKGKYTDNKNFQKMLILNLSCKLFK